LFELEKLFCLPYYWLYVLHKYSKKVHIRCVIFRAEKEEEKKN
jgi:hypothetical protein